MAPLKRLRARLENGVVRAWDTLSEGWRELLSRSSSALTHFTALPLLGKDKEVRRAFPQWSLLATETWETAHVVIVRMELPGMKKEDLDVTITENGLRVRGDKYSGDEEQGRLYHLMERAFGSFERTVALPRGIDSDNAELSYADGVLTVIVKKIIEIPPRQLPLP